MKNERNPEESDGPFDKAIFDNLRHLSGVEDEQMFAQLIAMFETQLQTSLEKMQRARSDSDIKGLMMTAHALKGSSGNIGATRLADLCGQLELAVRSPSIQDPDDCLSRIEAEIRLIQKTLADEQTRY